MKANSPVAAQLQEAADNFSKELTGSMYELVDGPVKELLGAFPVIRSNAQFTDEDKAAMYRYLQISLVSPFLGGGINAAYHSGMKLESFLGLVGRAWEEIGNQHKAKILADLQHNVQGTEGPTE